jgi:hypothetical protein
MKMDVNEFINRLEKLSKLRQQMLISEMFGMMKALGKKEFLEELIKEYENKK